MKESLSAAAWHAAVASHSSAALADLLREVVHDLNNPIAALLLLAPSSERLTTRLLAAQGHGDDRARDALGLALEEVHRDNGLAATEIRDRVEALTKIACQLDPLSPTATRG